MKQSSDCPICQKAAAKRPENQFAPFCSQRCQLVDLGQWLDGKYRLDDESRSPA